MRCLIVLMLASLSILSASSRYRTLILRNCPTNCTCSQTCQQNKSSRKLQCIAVNIKCSARDFSNLSNEMPLNVTGLLLSNNNVRQIDLDSLSNFTRLTVLVIKKYNATLIKISTKIRRLHGLNLQHNHFVSLPQRNLTKLKKLKHLNLANNWIHDISVVRFPTRLEILSLNDNRLRELRKGSFRKLKQLRVLKLNNNNIDFLHFLAFKDLVKLESLEIKNNKIRSLPRGVFTFLKSGWFIDLKNNSISEINPMSFRLFGFQNPNHHQIHLENNSLRFLEQDTIAILIPQKERYSMYFAGNPIFCDCNLVILRDEAEELLADTDNILCDSPREYRNTTLNNLAIDNCCF